MAKRSLQNLMWAGTALAIACANSPNLGATPQRVRFDYEDVTPQVARVSAGQSIHWINLAQDTRGYVILPASVSAGTSCASGPGPAFQRTGDGYLSQPITAFESQDVVLDCELAPGSYAYNIRIEGAGLGQSDPDGPGRNLSATIVVD